VRIPAAADRYAFARLRGQTDQEAIALLGPHWADVLDKAAAERDWARPTMDQFQAEIAADRCISGRRKRLPPRWRRSSGGSGSADSILPAPRGEYPTNRSGYARKIWRPRQDSNLRHRLRRPVLYPLSYGGWCGVVPAEDSPTRARVPAL
jgi:hypothetical protein